MCPLSTLAAEMIDMLLEMFHSRLKQVKFAFWWDLMVQVKPGHCIFQNVLTRKHAGKSTLLKLLNRLYDPSEGRILIDGHDIQTLKLADLRRCISVLFQDHTQFPLSVCRSTAASLISTFYLIQVSENIGMGDILHAWDEDQIRKAADLGGASDLIQSLPEGFDTVLSPPMRVYSGSPEGNFKDEYERLSRAVGKVQEPKLSGGQMQRLALCVIRYPYWHHT